ncbi:MAG: peptidoglycan-binding protein [Myxococcales bacterium]|nr:peptidoglycan-binding protein [Myxococcales bacterium]
MKVHRVRPGESIDSIAFRHGHHPETLWNHPENEALRESRESRTVLAPGDEVFIPELRPRVESRQTDRTHRFRRLAVPARIRVQLNLGNQILSEVSWRLEIPGFAEQSGTTGPDGVIEADAPPLATRGTLFFGDPPIEAVLQIGRLAPIGTDEGIRQRLANLGFLAADAKPRDEGALRLALLRLQQATSLEATGELDEDTRDALERIHDGGEGLEGAAP